MKILKRTLAIALVLIMLLGATSCAQKNNTNSTDFDSGSNSEADESSDLNINNDSEINGESESDTSFDDLVENGAIDTDIQIDESNKKDLARYSIIANKDNTLALNAATELSAKLAEKGITLPVNTSGVYEILIGNNDTPETKSASVQLSKLTRDYLIQFNDTKIVIVAKTDLALSEACNTFFEAYVSKLTGTIMTYKDGSTTSGTAKSLVNLAYSKKPQYSILTRDASAAVQARVTLLVDAIKEATGLAVFITTDKYSATENQIIIGDLGVRETMKVLASISENEYVISKVDKKVVIAGKTDTTTIRAIDAFIKLINDSKAANPDKSTFTISITESIKNSYCAPLSEIPRYPNATFSKTYTSGIGTPQQYYTSANPSGINSYVATLAELGYKKTEDNSINGNRFVTCYGTGGLIHISYLNHNKSLSVILDPLKKSTYKLSEPSYTKITDTTLAVMSVDYVLKDNKAGGGMSYIVTLDDGRYIIFDGGHRYDPWQADDIFVIYNYLKENNKRKDGKIVIAAWILTHGHKDHSGAFNDFAKRYGSKVTLEYIIYSPANNDYVEQEGKNYYLIDELPTIMSTYYKNTKAIIPHTGQKLTFCNVTFDVMYTHESRYPDNLRLVNDGSLVLRMTANGVTTMFLADLETDALFVNMYGSALKSDIVQTAHHGYSGGSQSLYQKIGASISLWTCSQAEYNERKVGTTGSGKGNAQVQNKWLATNTKTHYVADGNIEILKFVGGTSKVTKTDYKPNATKT